MHLILGLVGGLLGALQFSLGAVLLGVLLGVMAGEVISLRKRLAGLEKQFYSEKRLVKNVKPVSQVTASLLSTNDKHVNKDIAGIDPKQKFIAPKEMEAPGSNTDALVERLLSGFGEKATQLFHKVKLFFTSGNLVLKIGVIILFFGVSFLLKYAAQRNMIPIELRLIGVVLCGVIMLGTGWWLRRMKTGYGLVLQGGGLGVLYLVVFAAARLYTFLPISIALTVMIGLVMLSCMLAILQDSKSLAVFGIVGGFLAPVLMSTGDGNHVILFSYYALLNAGVLAISWFKAWRELNLLGFVFTFAIGTYWGSAGYRPEHFQSTEPFLILFFVFYVCISIFFAHRLPLNLRGYIDGPLVFGLPLVVSALQYCLVKDFQYGMAFSALGLGLVYLAVAALVRRQGVHSMGVLSEAFLALGVVFSSLSIPLAFDDHLSSSLWALEGAAIVWIGVRQQRTLARHFGLLLQLAAACIFVGWVWYPLNAFPFANRYFLGCLFLSLGALASSYCLDLNGQNLKKWERFFPFLLLIWGLAWWYIGGLREVDRQMPAREVISGLLLFCSASSILFGLTIQKLHWPRFKLSLLTQLPAMAMFVLFSLVDSHSSFHLLRGSGTVAWTIAFAVQYRILYNYSEDWPGRYRQYWHIGTMWLLLYTVCHEVAWWIGGIESIAVTWPVISWGLIPCGLLLTIIALSKGHSWPVGKLSSVYLGLGSGPVAIALFYWIVVSFTLDGDPAPLSYLIFFNPLELTELSIIITIVLWLSACKADGLLPKHLLGKWCLWWPGVLFFLWLNSVVARSVHFYVDVPYSPASLYNSVIFQAAIAALWGFGALAITIWATRRGSRSLWGAGALLLVMVVIKLLLVDLSGTGTIARIVSFLVVGVLMLIIGYFSPVPPHPVTQDTSLQKDRIEI